MTLFWQAVVGLGAAVAGELVLLLSVLWAFPRRESDDERGGVR